MKDVAIASLTVSNTRPFTLISGPCQIETRDHALMMAERLSEMTQAVGVPFIYKSSFDKANRTSANSARGIGMDTGLKILDEIRRTFGVPVITDVHLPEQCAAVAEAVDILQIPAFLSRQTDLLVAAAETGKPVMVKKGQFLAPQDMHNVAGKLEAAGNNQILLCDRGTSFGYNTLVSDFRGLPIMAQTGYPVVFDATHSVQMPGGAGASSGGDRDFAPPLARAALAVGCAAIFAECHDNPDEAPSDGPVMLFLDDMPQHLASWKAIDDLIKT